MGAIGALASKACADAAGPSALAPAPIVTAAFSGLVAPAVAVFMRPAAPSSSRRLKLGKSV